MATDILQQLLSSSSSRGVSAQLLESLGRKAATQFLKGESSLNDSITSLSSEYPDLQNEHIKRIAEFANNSVFQEMHSSGEDKNVHFEVADPGVIIRDLKDGGSPAHDGKTMYNSTDYADKPGNGSDMGEFEDAFQEHAQMSNQEPEQESVKLASVSSHQLHANPIDDAYDAHLRLKASREKVAEVHERFDMILKQAEEDFYQIAKSEVLDPDGFGIRGVVGATESVSPTDGIAFQALQKVAIRLVKEGAISSKELDKTASAGSMKVVNEAHPLVVSFAGLVKAAQEKVRAATALQEIDSGLHQTDSFLRSLR